MTYAEAVDHLFSLGPELATSSSALATSSSALATSGSALAASSSALGAPSTGPLRKFDLDHMRALAAELGDPQSAFPSVLIAGTNGKGSTAATLASILTAAGYRTGLYTSPHLVRPNERIQLAHPVLPSEYGAIASHGADGPLALTPIADEDFARLYTRVDAACTALLARAALPILPSFFERVTAVAFLYFAESKIEIALLEVGLGGRLDATNIVSPLLTILTDIALDHQEYLGSTIAAIAREKCGILRPGVPLVTLSQHPEANQAIGEAAAALGVPGINAAPYLPPAQRNYASSAPVSAPAAPDLPLHATHTQGAAHTGSAAPNTLPETPTQRAAGPLLPRNCYTLPVDGQPLEIDSPLSGEHQQRNLALALAAAVTLRNQFSYNITNPAMEAGIRNTNWPGRLEFLPPNLLLDVAHNPAGAWTLRAALAALPPATPRTLLFSCLRDKSLEEMSRILFPLFDSSSTDPLRRHDHIVLAPIASPRAAAVQDLLAAAHALGIPAHAAPHLSGALHQARQITPPGGLVIATGSVYLVGEIRQLVVSEPPPAAQATLPAETAHA